MNGVGYAVGTGGDPRQTVESLVMREMEQGKPRHEAFKQVMKKNPQLRAQYVAQANQK